MATHKTGLAVMSASVSDSLSKLMVTKKGKKESKETEKTKKGKKESKEREKTKKGKKESKETEKTKKGKPYTLEEVKTLGRKLLESISNINNAPVLISFLSPSSPPQHALECLLSLQSFFTPQLPNLPPPSSSKTPFTAEKNDPDTMHRSWLRSTFDQFISSLINLACSLESDELIREVALDAIMEFVKLGKNGTFWSAIYHKLLHCMVHSTSDDLLLDLLVSKYLKYVDVRYFTYISLQKLARSLEAINIAENGNVGSGDDGKHASVSSNGVPAVRKIYDILLCIPPLEGQDGQSNPEMWSHLDFAYIKPEHKPSSGVMLGEDSTEKLERGNNVLPTSFVSRRMKLKFTKAWLSFLRLPLPLDVYKEVLVNLHQVVIPHMSNPVVLSDFLTRSYDIGGVISVMALSSFFVLMTQYGLEYPNFYDKLYALLVPAVFMAKHRKRFFELLDSCLKSTLLPAYIAAAFAKKLSRLSLSVPPSGILVIIGIIHNLLRRHPSINFLVHWQVDDGTGGYATEGEMESGEGAKESAAPPNMSSVKRGIDPFNDEEKDPSKSNAMRSSLWEIDTLRHHYCPAVSRFVTSLENDLTVRAKTSEITIKDFSSGSYTTIFREEIRRRIKQVPLAFYKTTPVALFSESDFPGWAFEFGKSDKHKTGANETGEVNSCEADDSKSSKRQQLECS